MAKAAKRPCKHPGCPNLTAGSYCKVHAQDARRYEVARGSSSQRGYDSRWRKVRATKLQENPLCERCKAAGRVRPATLVHHIDRNPRNNQLSNLESCCVSCHEAEHKGDRFGNACR